MITPMSLVIAITHIPGKTRIINFHAFQVLNALYYSLVMKIYLLQKIKGVIVGIQIVFKNLQLK